MIAFACGLGSIIQQALLGIMTITALAVLPVS
jgi:hypothetical protein